jgi:CheY-like chemotaxis protein/two-component sensor histidine kinase
VRITDDLLDISRITQNRIELRRDRIDLRAAVHSAVEATRPMIDAEAHTLAIDLPETPLWADADFTRLSQAFSNLLTNAAKYTARGGRVTVSATNDASVAAITVADTGSGIPPAMLPNIFDMFTQLQAHRDRAHGGLGIGLTLAKRLVELHGGTIEAMSDGPGRGSRFTVRLPLLPAEADQPAAARRDDARGSAGVRVLIADDNADTAEMMAVMLGFKGHDVRVARDGIEAVDTAKTFGPQIAFLDIGMPRMDGYEAARRIRALPGRHIVLVALTGWGQDDDKRRSRDAGFDHHLTKPPEPEVLDRLVAGCAE